MYGLIYNYYTQNKSILKTPCSWEFAASIDCSGNVMYTRNGIGGGWNNTNEVLYPNAIPCTYKVQISGVNDDYQYNCSIINGERYINNYDNNILWNENIDTTNRNDFLLGKLHLCNDNNTYSVNKNPFYIDDEHSITLSLFIGGNDPIAPSSGVKSDSYGNINRNLTLSPIGSIIPRYWIKLYTDDITCYFDTNIEYSGAFAITNARITNDNVDFCGTTKIDSGIDLRNTTFSVNNPIIIDNRACKICNTQYRNMQLTLIPFDDCSDIYYDRKYPSVFSKIIETSGFPSIASIHFSGIYSEHANLLESQYTLSTCDASKLNDTFYLKRTNPEWYFPLDELQNDYSNYNLDITDYNICSECDRNPYITDLQLYIGRTRDYNDGDIAVYVNSESGVIAKFTKRITAWPIQAGTYTLEPSYINMNFYPQIDFSGSVATVTLDTPINTKCYPVAPSPHYSGTYNGNVAVTIPSNYTDVGTPNTDIGGHTFILNNGNYFGANFNINLFEEISVPNNRLKLSIIESNYILGGRYRYTYYSIDLPTMDCYGSDVSNLIGSNLYPMSGACSQFNPFYPTCSSYETFTLTVGNALGSVLIS